MTGAAVESILSRSYADFELPIIDEGTVGEIRAFPDRRIRLIIREHNPGNAAAVNKGVEICCHSLVSRSFGEQRQRPIVRNIATRLSFINLGRPLAYSGQTASGLKETLARLRLTLCKPYDH